MAAEVWVATAPIWLGNVRAYNLNNVVPDSVVTRFSLDTEGLVEKRPASDEGVPTHGVDVATQAELASALALKADAVALAGKLDQAAGDARYPRKGDLVVNVKDYGAKGDGSTDDTAAINAAFAAAAAITSATQLASNNDGVTLPVRPLVYFPSGTYPVSSQITIPQGCSYTMADGATVKATAAMVAIFNTDPAVLHQGSRWLGGALNCNGLAQSAFVLGCAIACDLHISEVYNPTQHGVIVGDPAASLVPYEIDVKIRRFWRPRGTTPPVGNAALWVRHCTDSIVEIGSVRGFDIGTKNDGGNIEFRTVHPWNPTGSPGPSVCHDEGAACSGTRLVGYVFDSPSVYGLRVRGAGPLTLIAPQFYLNSGVADNTAIAIQCDASPALTSMGGAIYSAGASNRWKNDIVVSGVPQKIRWMTYSDGNTVATRKWGDRFYAAGWIFDSGSITPLQFTAGSAADLMQVFVSGAKVFSVTNKGGVTTGDGVGTGVTTYSGSSAPSNTLGVDGDHYWRRDTPTVSNQRLYVKAAGAWTGIL